MCNKSLLLALAITLLASSLAAQSSVVPLNSNQKQLIDKFVTDVSGSPRPVMPARIVDYSIYSISFTGATMGTITVPKKYKKFNPKRDKITNVVIEDHNISSNRYQISVVHKNGKACDMNEFNIRVEATNLECTDNGNFSNYNVAGTIWDYLDGTLPMEGDIVITHIESGLSTKIHYVLNIMPSKYNWRGTDGAFLYEKVASASHPNYYTLLNMSRGLMFVTYDKTQIDVSGVDGANGADGYNGWSGHDTYTYTKKDGTKVTVKGTCGNPGGNGGNGGNGQDGGHAYVMVGPGCGSSMTVNYGGGAAGRGGAAGIGGRHGKGSPCSGRAPNGIPGRDGIPGAKGSVQFTYLDASNLLLNYYNGSAQIVRQYPIIQVDKSVKLKRKSHDKKNKAADKKVSEGAVDF